MSAKEADCPSGREALETLCRTYWPPIYAHIRKRGHQSADSQDLTQQFFARFLEKDYLRHLNHQEGKFRSFLLTLLSHFLNDEHDKRCAQKRGGGQLHISIDEFSAVESQLLHQTRSAPAGADFDRDWARTILRKAGQRLEEEWDQRGLAATFHALRRFLQGGEDQPKYADLASQLGMTPEALRQAVARLRARYGNLIREEVRQTVAEPAQVDEEIRHLIRVVSESPGE